MTAVSYFAGLDLGQASEFTGLCVLEKTQLGEAADERTVFLPNYAVRHLQRFPLGTSYPEIFANVATLFENYPLAPARCLSRRRASLQARGDRKNARLPGRHVEIQPMAQKIGAIPVVRGCSELILKAPFFATKVGELEANMALALVG
jgi:hypothetical protein